MKQNDPCSRIQSDITENEELPGNMTTSDNFYLGKLHFPYIQFHCAFPVDSVLNQSGVSDTMTVNNM
jgi:hypothetical protein